MSAREERSTLSHEVAHASTGDEFTDLDYFSTKQENRANLRASRALLDFEEYQKAERLHGCHIPSLAQELNVTEEILLFWHRWLSGIQLPRFVGGKYLSTWRVHQNPSGRGDHIDPQLW